MAINLLKSFLDFFCHNLPRQRGELNKGFAYQGGQTKLRFSYSFKTRICIDLMKQKKKECNNQSINQSTLFKHGKWLSTLVFRHAVW